ncbi:hypothetical protein ABW20_dc0108920 [Dactylellina cionopaga]|nr:hypothetical protein ABW20_dc0108920 [Dactylellina cionopaga]
MAEAVGIVIGLASLYQACIEGFECMKAARNADSGLKTLLVKFDLEKSRLLIWGDQVGIHKFRGKGRSRYLDDYRDAIIATLREMWNLFQNADDLRARYGLRTETETNSNEMTVRDDSSRGAMRLYMSSWAMFKVRYQPTPFGKDILSRARWAISDSGKFKTLINQIKDLIDSLNQCTNISQAVVDGIMLRDITLIENMERLALVRDASADVYKAWAERASTIIEQSEAGSILPGTDQNAVLENEGQPPSSSGDQISNFICMYEQ